MTQLRARTRIGPDPLAVDMPELVHEFEQMIESIGSHVVYVRLDKRRKHDCWDSVRQQSAGLDLCPECYGMGFEIAMERHLARNWFPSPGGAQSQAYTQTWPGMLMDAYTVVAFKPVVRPQLGDLVFRVEWDKNTGLPLNLLEALEIRKVNDMREEQGYLVYYQCYATVSGVNRVVVEDLLRKETRIRVID